MPEIWKKIIAIAIGAAMGTISRYALNLFTLETGFPYGTLIENIVGSGLLGFLTAWFLVFVPKEWLKVGLGVGFCGGFTTMSTFAADASFLFQNQSIFQATLYVFSSIMGGLLVAFFGFLFGQRMATKTKNKLEVERG